MSILSRLRTVVTPAIALRRRSKNQQQVVRLSHDRVMEIKPSQLMWKVFFNDMHFYLLLTGLPLAAFITAINIFIGPATLSDIPEGYEPEFPEYHRHPITRFLCKYLIRSPQSVYEINMHNLQQEHEKLELKKIAKRVEALQRKRGDYQYWYNVPMRSEVMTKVIIRDVERQESILHPDI